MATSRECGECSRGSNFDVFLSFRGPDTRHGFVDFLYHQMTDAGIRVFLDNERLHVGEVIGEELMRAIDNSKICIPVFSRNYASSKWCVLELQRIMMGRSGQEVLPTFYDVSPDDVKLRTSLYSDDLDKLEEKHGTDAVDQWRKCLKEVCKIKGWNLEESPEQGKLIKRIVQDVLYKTKKRYKDVTRHLIRIEGQIETLMKLLDDQIDRVRFVIIHGMGGIGKTTLAKVIFNDVCVSSKYEGYSFLLNVRESSQGNGIVKLQQQILNDVLRTSVTLSDVDDGVNEIRERCSNKRVLLVLDDVDDTKQVENLAGMFDWFGNGSRIIITTRDSSVVPKELLSYHDSICYYEMQKMEDQYATDLFQRHAFSDDGNSFNDSKLIREIVARMDGLPLALEVVGSHLFRKPEAIWRETLRKLNRAPDKRVWNALIISYESLEADEKEIFLDIACFFLGIECRIPKYVWEASELFIESGMIALLHKSLIKIDDKNRIWMHDQLRDLGREIVRRDGKSSRIWIHEEALLMLSNKKGTRDVLLLDLQEFSSCIFQKDVLEELVNLRVLRIRGGNLVGDFSNCFQQLMYLHWSSFPFIFQAQNFNLPNLVVLRFTYTFIDERWIGWKGLLGSKLKLLELSECGELTRTPDFSTCLGLEVLVLRYNDRLMEIDSSIGKLKQLLHLEIEGSLNLRGLPQSLESLKRLEKLIVTMYEYEVDAVKFYLPIEFDRLKSLCHLAIVGVKLESLPKGIGQLKFLKYLSLARCSLVELNPSVTELDDISEKIGSMEGLKVLNLSHNMNIRTLPKGIGDLVKLEELDLSYCSDLDHIPREIGNLFSLRILYLRNTGIVELPSSVIRLSHLQYLYMEDCKNLRRVEQLPTSLSHLSLPYFSLQVVPDLSNLVSIVKLELSASIVEWPPITDDEEDRWRRFRSLAWIGRLPKLKRLVIRGISSDIFNELPVDFSSKCSVELEDLSCSDPQSLHQLNHNLYRLIITEFRATILDLSFPNLKNLSEITIVDSLSDEIELRGLELLGNLQNIHVLSCKSLERLSISSCPEKLNELQILNCSKLVEVEGICRFESMQRLKCIGCPSLSRLSDLSNLVKLKYLEIRGCDSIERMPALPKTQNPFYLHVAGCRKLPGYSGPYHPFYLTLKIINK